MKIIFLRHGESQANVWGGMYENDATNFLSLRGSKQAELAGYTVEDELGSIDVVISSGLTRARQTSSIAMQIHGDWKRSYEVDERLNEWCYMYGWTPANEWWEAETPADFWERVTDFYETRIKRFSDIDGTMLITSHYYTMWALFELIRRDIEQDGESPLPDPDPSTGAKIPNAVPYYYDTTMDVIPEMIIPGMHSVSH